MQSPASTKGSPRITDVGVHSEREVVLGTYND